MTCKRPGAEKGNRPAAGVIKTRCIIVSVSYRTDIPAFYGAWVAARLAAGECYVRNPNGGAPYRVALDPESADGCVFGRATRGRFCPCSTRSPPGASLSCCRPRSPDIRAPSIATYRPPAPVIRTLVTIARDHGPEVVVWRYDPILLTDHLTAAWHRRNFAGLAARLAPLTDEVVVSFAHFYAKSTRNLAAAGIAWRDPPADEKRALLAYLAKIAGDHGLALTVCSQSDLTMAPIAAARCVDAGRLARIAGRPIAARTKGNRPGCLCAESRDIGVYDSCVHGCTYCYAVRAPPMWPPPTAFDGRANRWARRLRQAVVSTEPLAPLETPTIAGRSKRSPMAYPACITCITVPAA